MIRVRRALVSVSNKDGVAELAGGLHRQGIEIISTGGTADTIRGADVPVRDVAEVTGFPEILDGRVKTLHPFIHGGLLADRNKTEHLEELTRHGIRPIELVVVNLYPFREVTAGGAGLREAMENIDIGGPTMIRAAAKNHDSVTVVVDPEDYGDLLRELEENEGCVGLETRRRLADKAFAHTAAYDQAIADYLLREGEEQGEGDFPRCFAPRMTRVQDLRYGENPHQSAAFYREDPPVAGTISSARQLQGRELSFNNINDTNAALEAVLEYEHPAVVGLKHTNPCGVAVSDSISRACARALQADPVSIFGGIVAFNREVDRACAEEMVDFFLECVIAPSYSPDALEILARKEQLRLLEVDIPGNGVNGLDYKRVGGGLLVQDLDRVDLDEDELTVPTSRVPSEREMQDLRFAWKVVKHVKSNAIVIARDLGTTGIGAGQVNRLWATQQAIRHAGEEAAGSVLASDAFFPFKDSVETAAQAGITAIIQPGGSIRDEESIAAADRNDMAMVLTGIRHFRH